jgi:peptide deformylase
MLEIKTLGEKCLKQKAKRVDRVDDTIRNLCASMIDVMIKNNGIGLAANQVGVLKRIIVVSDNKDIKILINPEIIFKSDQTCEFEEGCLSIPGSFLNIIRSKSIKIKYRDTKGRYHIEEYSGLTSRIIQHEIDHLDGITMDSLDTVYYAN